MRISWDEALDEIAARFKAIIAEHGAEALMPFHYLGSMGVVQRFALMRVFHALGASLPVGGVCAVSAGALMSEGHPIARRSRGCRPRAADHPVGPERPDHQPSSLAFPRRSAQARRAHRDDRSAQHAHRQGLGRASAHHSGLRCRARRGDGAGDDQRGTGRYRWRDGRGIRFRGLSRERDGMDLAARGGGDGA